ncbi:MAG: hypothetical protein ACE5GO_06925 [Anaerolineales bacterium]
MVRHLFTHWKGNEVSLVMDRTDLQNRWSILSLGVAYRKRVLPLAWEVLPFGSTSAEEQIALLEWVHPFIPSPEQTPVYFYGDAEFRAVALQQTCQRYHWHWHVGLKTDLLFHAGDGNWRPLSSLGLQPGGRCYLQQIQLTRKHDFGPVNLPTHSVPHPPTPIFRMISSLLRKSYTKF